MTIQSPFLRQLELPSLDGTLAKTKVLATHYGKSNDYILVQPFTVSPVVWEGVSLIVKKYQITLPKNISIVQLPAKPAGVNFCPCIFWTVSEGVGHRYKLWDNVGEILFADLYTNQRIPSTFILEIWNTEDETDATLSTTLEIIVSTLSAHTTYCGDGGTEADSSTISGGDYVFDSGGLSVDYGLGDKWLLTPLDTVVFDNVADPEPPPVGEDSPEDYEYVLIWLDAENLAVTKPGITDGQAIGMSFPVYSGWHSLSTYIPYIAYQAASEFRPTYKTNIMGAKPGVLFADDQLPAFTSLEPAGVITLAVVCKELTQPGVLFGGPKLTIYTTADNKIAVGYTSSTGWTIIYSDVLTVAATDARLLIAKLDFASGQYSFRENKTAKGSGSFTRVYADDYFTSVCADAEGTDMFGGYLFEFIVWYQGMTGITDEQFDALYDNYYKPKWTELP